MPEVNQAALEFLMTRRSRPAKTLDLPIPDRTELLSLLMAAARTPDHGKLEPWRFIVLSKDKLRSLADLVANRGAALGHEPEKIEKAQGAYNTGHLAVAVIEVQKPSEKIPEIEQTYSAGAVCLALLNAALASGWGQIGFLVGHRMTADLSSLALVWQEMNALLGLFIWVQNAPHHQSVRAPTLTIL